MGSSPLSIDVYVAPMRPYARPGCGVRLVRGLRLAIRARAATPVPVAVWAI